MTSDGQCAAGPRMKVLVGVQDEGMNGIETYAEQVALAARSAGHEVTLIVTTAGAARSVRGRIGTTGIEIFELGVAPISPRRQFAERLWVGLQAQRIGASLRAASLDRLRGYDVIHLNRAALVPFFTGLSERIFVAGWFYPHARLPRLRETWRHARGPLMRRAAITAKSLAFFQADERGYRAATAIIACSETLAAQLRQQGRRAIACPPPVQVEIPGSGEESRSADGALNLLVCCGDLSHPRKNLGDAVRCLRILAQRNRPVVLRAIGRNFEALSREVGQLPHWARLEPLGPRPPTEVHAEMRRADVFVLPSLYEEWGYVAVESILSGTPVATYPVYPFSDMLAGGLGVVAMELRVNALCDAIERGAATGLRGSALSQAGQERFGSAAVGERLGRIWQGHGEL